MPGSSISGWRWVTRPTILSPTRTSSISRMPAARLTTSGTTVCGKTTSDRKGSSGTRSAPAAAAGRSASTIERPARGCRSGAGALVGDAGFFLSHRRVDFAIRFVPIACHPGRCADRRSPPEILGHQPPERKGPPLPAAPIAANRRSSEVFDQEVPRTSAVPPGPIRRELQTKCPPRPRPPDGRRAARVQVSVEEPDDRGNLPLGDPPMNHDRPPGR